MLTEARGPGETEDTQGDPDLVGQGFNPSMSIWSPQEQELRSMPNSMDSLGPEIKQPC